MNKPFANLMPPLTTEEFSALKADISANGVRIPIDVDEHGNVLDGHNRLKIDPMAPRRIIQGLSEAEKEAHVYRANLNRRNLSPSQKKELLKALKKLAARLRAEGKTQAQVATTLGMARETVRNWERGSNGQEANASTAPDARVKVSPKERPKVARRVAKGEKPEQVAADYGVTPRTIRTIVTQETETQERKQARESTAAVRSETMIVGDFRDTALLALADRSVDLVFTDPPYDHESVGLYEAIAELCASKLKPGGWCVAYSGHLHFFEVGDAMRKHLQYGWMFAVVHSGGDTRFRKLRLQSKWKPIVGFYRPPLDIWWDWFTDAVSGGKEKTEHAWQQAESEAAHFIDALTPKGGLVVDFCTGSGTTGVAAKALNRSFIGFEIDAATAANAIVRIG